MPADDPRGTLALLGSGELAPSMVAIHRRLLQELHDVRAVFLDATFGFQENADELVAKAVDYFDVSLSTRLEVAHCRRVEALSPLERGRALEALAQATYIFAGPGSPSYALQQFHALGAEDVLRQRLADGATIVFASAAALTAGLVTMPVYEIYKAGHDPYWLRGLDLLGSFGLRAAVIPHYDNKEGATHDTRFCYVGDRRLRQLERDLPEDAGILGVDEHTAVIVDAHRVRVLGKGRLTLRRQGEEQAFQAPAELALTEVRDILDQSSVSPSRRSATQLTATLELVADRLATAGPAAALAVVADLVGVDDDGARAGLAHILRHLDDGHIDRAAILAPLVEAILEERSAARDARDWQLADRLRDTLSRGGILVEDTPTGTQWKLSEAVH